jgi:hypothetical protein
MYKKTIAVALLYALFATPVAAQNYVINVNGIVCEFCAYGIGKKIRKLSFIDPSQYDEGVRSTLKINAYLLPFARVRHWTSQCSSRLLNPAATIQ